VDRAGPPWIAEIGDDHPSIQLTWKESETVGSIYLGLTNQASRPTKISIKGATGAPMVLAVPKTGGTISFSPMVTNSLTINFISVDPKTSLSPTYGISLTLPVGLAAIGVPGHINGVPPNPDQRFTLPCGQGPSIEVDGAPIPTAVSGTLGDLEDFKPLPFTACTPPGGLKLASGNHTFNAKTTTAPFEVTSVALQDTLTPPPVAAAARTVKVEKWKTESRTIAVGAGPASYVVLSQNYNPGWVATMGGRTLKPVRIDGWRQGYLVPAGGRAILTLVMAPDTIFRWFLAIGAALLLGLAALALWPSRRKPPDSSGPRSPPSFWVLLVGSLAVLALVAGPLCLVALPLLWVARRWGTVVLAVTAFVAFTAAGVAAAWRPAVLHVVGAGAFGAPAQAGTAIAVAAVLMGVVIGGKGFGKRDRGRVRPPEETLREPPTGSFSRSESD
jgi:arabinofuranan 3-O-arabinosyltransferase